MKAFKGVIIALCLLGLSACAVETGPPVSRQELQRTQVEIWEIKLREYLKCQSRVGKVLIRLLPHTDREERSYPWFLVKGVDLEKTPPEVDQALSRIFARSLPSKGLLLTFVHPYYKERGLVPGKMVNRVQTFKARLGEPVRLWVEGRPWSAKPLELHTRPVDFQIVDKPEPNAWVTPEYKMYVTLGLCRVLPEEEELAAVVGHELAHLKRGHLQKQVLLTTLRDLLGLGISAVAGETATDLYRLGTNFALLKFSRDQEREADFYGLWYLSRAGYNLDRAAQVWVHLAAVLPPGPASILSTHPPTAERLARIRKIVSYIHQGKSFEEIRHLNP